MPNLTLLKMSNAHHTSRTLLPFARKFPSKMKFWYLQGKMQGIKIDKKIARKSSLKQGIERNFKILQQTISLWIYWKSVFKFKF
jgi:hypothetical protein